MTTVSKLTTMIDDLLMVTNSIIEKPAVIIDERNVNYTVYEPLRSLTVTDGGSGSNITSYQPIERFVLGPYADNLTASLHNDVRQVQANDVWYNQLTFVGNVGQFDLVQFDYGEIAVYGDVDVLELSDSRASDLSVYGVTDLVNATSLRDVDLTFSEISDAFEFSGLSDSTARIGFADDITGQIEDSDDLSVSMLSADGTVLTLRDLSGLDLRIAMGDVVANGSEIDGSSIESGSGHDYFVLNDFTNGTIDTGAGHDSVNLREADQTAVRTGEGNDFFSFTTADPAAQVAYNLGAGHDFGIIAGGNTLGVLDDGEKDIIIFNADKGGQHIVFADEKDQFLIQFEGELWDAAMIDFVDQGGQNDVAEVGNFSLAMYIQETEILSPDPYLG